MSMLSTSAPEATRAGPPVQLLGLSRAELAAQLEALGVPERQSRMRVRQLWNWLYVRGATDFDGMTDIAKELRAELGRAFTLARPEIVTEQVSMDGTRKWLLRLADGKEVETVYIPEEDRGTLCISSQVGCTLTCSFCHTGTQALVRNLTPGEIVGQIVIARDRVGDWPGVGPMTRAGSPARSARSPMSCSWAWASRSTISTTCATPWPSPPTARGCPSPSAASPCRRRASRRRSRAGVRRPAPCSPSRCMRCATSLRDQLVPINKKWPIKDLLDACRAYPGLSNAKRITFEYVMLKGVNDSIADAKALVRLLAKIPAKINLIPFNPWPGAPFECSDWDQIEKFAEVVNRAGYASPVRSPAAATSWPPAASSKAPA